MVDTGYWGHNARPDARRPQADRARGARQAGQRRGGADRAAGPGRRDRGEGEGAEESARRSAMTAKPFHRVAHGQ